MLLTTIIPKSKEYYLKGTGNNKWRCFSSKLWHHLETGLKTHLLWQERHNLS